MKLKFRAHETFFIRKGWLSKGMRCVLDNPNVFMGFDKEGTTRINPMDSLGLGANMVKSLRYWLQATGLTKEPPSGKKYQELTELGELVYKNDPYIEEVGTLCLLHEELCTKEKEVSAWYFFFNIFSLRSFAKDDFVTAIDSYIALNSGEQVARRSLEDDFNCIVNTYVSREKSSTARVSPENNIDCPFGELGLLDIESRKAKTYRKRSASKTVPPSLAALAFIAKQATTEGSEIQISRLLNDEKSIGRVFNLDTISLSSLLSGLEDQGHLRIIRTAGLDVIKLTREIDYMQCVADYYKSIG